MRDVMDVSISLFSSAGIGDLGVEYGCGIPVVVSCELLPERADLIKRNYPQTTVVQGDIRKKWGEVVTQSQLVLNGRNPLLMTISPPCQGMSTNGAGRIASEIRKGSRTKFDERNELILPALKVIRKLQPEHFLIENVPNMLNTTVLLNGKEEKLIEILPRRVGKGYDIYTFVQDFTKYGVPHRRMRAITIGVYNGGKSTTVTHRAPDWFDQGSVEDIISVSNAISNHTRVSSTDSLHKMPRMSEKHIHWISSIPPRSGMTAHLNPCLCGNNEDRGVILCSSCGSLMPRPNVAEKDGTVRPVKGYLTSYRRMKPNEPATTITMNSGVVSSDNKVHYSENRVLTLREILILSTIRDITATGFKTKHDWSGKYDFEGDSDINYSSQKNIIREVVGERIPPLAMKRMGSSLLFSEK